MHFSLQPQYDKEPDLVDMNFHSRTVLSVEKKKYLEITAFNETFIPLGLNWYITSNRIAAKITQCLCTRPKAGSSRTQYRSAVLKWSSRRRERSRKILTPHGDGRSSSSQHQRKGGLSCSVWWAERLEAAWSSRVFLPPINKPPKNKQFHPAEKEMGQRDEREGQTGVREEWHLWQGPVREKLEEMRGRGCLHERSIRLVVSLFLACWFGF